MYALTSREVSICQYVADMQDSRKHLTATTATTAAVVGGVVGVAVVWASRPDPPSCTTLGNGMRACMPIHAVDPAMWLYAAFAAIGAAIAGGVTFGYLFARRARAR